MRSELSKHIEKYLITNPKSFFLTGDLGYNALENIQTSAGNRFINSGVAEQNMIGVSAGLAYSGFETFVYSIAPFVVFRCLEQIKIDVCIHDLPVYIIGNGGGYGYGIMGATHHSIEDIACMSPLPNMTCWIPAFQEDVEFCINEITKRKKPAYLRLGLGKSYPNKLKISSINKILGSDHPQITILVLGPVIHNVLEAAENISGIEVFTILSVPIIDDCDLLTNSIKKSKKLLVIQEHVQRGGIGEYILTYLFNLNIQVNTFKSLHALGYPSKLYGNQAFHQKESGLDKDNIRKEILIILK
jgi:transketolase